MSRMMRKDRQRGADSDWLDNCPGPDCDQDDDDESDDPDGDYDLDDDSEEEETQARMGIAGTDDPWTDITDGIENYPQRPHRRPTTGLRKYAQKFMGGGHSRFPDKIFEGPNEIRIHDISRSEWSKMPVPGGTDDPVPRTALTPTRKWPVNWPRSFTRGRTYPTTPTQPPATT